MLYFKQKFCRKFADYLLHFAAILFNTQLKLKKLPAAGISILIARK